jgi:hypothetical protein
MLDSMSTRFWILLLPLFFFACNDNKKEVAKKPAALPPLYYYYPRANVYFDSANKDYVFLATDGVTWQTAKQIPNIVQGLMDKSVLIENPSQPVWKDNEKHKLVYSALLYATPNDTVEKKEPPKSVIKPEKTPDTLAAPKKKQSGLKRLLDKIFGGFKKEKKKKDTAQ